MSDNARYAIVTPYYKEDKPLIERCISSVRRQTFPTDHFVVADGFPQAWIDDARVRHLKLDRAHGDFGNTPRGVGALIAIAEEYSGIGLLDADNWLENHHVEACLAAARAKGMPCDYVIAQRAFRRPDTTIMPVRDEQTINVDTNCFFFLRARLA
jgi:glycosyltransferase involved in cell wall biosynthesis